MPLIIIFLIILPQQRTAQKAVLSRIRKRKGVGKMLNELIKKNIGKKCHLNSGSFGTNVKGKIIDVNENWIELETKKGTELINAEFVQSIKILDV